MANRTIGYTAPAHLPNPKVGAARELLYALYNNGNLNASEKVTVDIIRDNYLNETVDIDDILIDLVAAGNSMGDVSNGTFMSKIERLIRTLEIRDPVFGAPSNLFGLGTKGAWYDPSDHTTLFQDSAGTTPANSPGDPVALVLDKSEGLVLGPELNTGPTVIDAPWVDNGDGSYSGGGGSGATIRFDGIGVEVGKSYQIIATTSAAPTGQVVVKLNGGNIYPLQDGQENTLILSDATADGFQLVAQAGYDGTVSSISVRELPGHHAYQDTNNDKRPTLGRHPASGLRNLLDASEDFSDAVWAKTRLTVSGEKLIPNTETNSHYMTQGAVTSGNYALQMEAKADGYDYIQFVVAPGFPRASFNVANGTLGTIPAGYTATISDAGDGYYRCTLVPNIAITQSYIQVANADDANGFAGDGASGVLVRKVQQELGVSPTAYQKRVDQYDVTEAGQRDLWYLDFDGVDDYLETAAIDFTGTDKMSVFAGVDPDGAGMIVEASVAASVGNPGSFHVYAVSDNYQVRSVGTAQASSLSIGQNFDTTLLTSLGDISGDSLKLRANGAEIVDNTQDQGTGNYGNYPLYIGARAGSSLFFNGRLYGLAIVGKQTTDAEIANTERYLAGKSGVTL